MSVSGGDGDGGGGDGGSKPFMKYLNEEEYQKQKKEYTEKALKELQKQMKYYDKPNVKPNVKPNNNGIDGNNLEDEFQVDNLEHNVRDVDRLVYKGRTARSKSQDDNITCTIYAQRELDLQEIARLKTIMNRLESILDEESRKNHFLKLDLNNANVDNSNLQQELKVYRNENEKLKKENFNNWIIILSLKLLIVLFIVQFIYSCF
jgi:thioester reductase-like protein